MSAGCNSSSPGHANHEAESLPHRARHWESDSDHPDPLHSESAGENNFAEFFFFELKFADKYQELSHRHFGLIAKTIALAVEQITLWKLKVLEKMIKLSFLYPWIHSSIVFFYFIILIHKSHDCRQLSKLFKLSKDKNNWNKKIEIKSELYIETFHIWINLNILVFHVSIYIRAKIYLFLLISFTLLFIKCIYCIQFDLIYIIQRCWQGSLQNKEIVIRNMK